MASGQYVPHQQAAHMAAPTEGQNIKKALANGEPSTHGAERTLADLGRMAAFDPKRTFVLTAIVPPFRLGGCGRSLCAGEG
jgi:hypothetical protein